MVEVIQNVHFRKKVKPKKKPKHNRILPQKNAFVRCSSGISLTNSSVSCHYLTSYSKQGMSNSTEAFPQIKYDKPARTRYERRINHEPIYALSRGAFPLKGLLLEMEMANQRDFILKEISKD